MGCHWNPWSSDSFLLDLSLCHSLSLSCFSSIFILLSLSASHLLLNKIHTIHFSIWSHLHLNLSRGFSLKIIIIRSYQGLDSEYISIPSHLSRPSFFICFLFLSLVRSSLFVLADLLLPLLDFLHVGMDHSWTWRRWFLEINWLSLTPLQSRASQRIFPSRNRLKSVLLKSRLATLTSALFPLLKVLNSTLSWLPVKAASSFHIPVQYSLICKYVVQQSMFPHQLIQEVAINTFQKPPKTQVRHNKGVYEDSAALGFLPSFAGFYLACYLVGVALQGPEKGSCMLNAAPTLDGGQACSQKLYLSRKDKQKIEIRRISNTLWISVHLVKAFQTGIFVSVLNCMKIKTQSFLFVYICIHGIYSFYIYRKGMSGHVSKQPKLWIFLKSSLFVAFLWTHFKIRKNS